MKIVKLNRNLRSQVESLRNDHASVIAQFNGRNKEFSRLDARRQNLEKEISKMETDADPDDRKTIHALAEKQVEHGLVVKRLSGFANAADEPNEQLAPLMARAQEIIPAALNPMVEKFVGDIQRLIRPHFQDDALATYTARSMPSAVNLAQWANWPSRFAGDSIANAQAIVKRCDDILAGEFPWQFDPKMK